MLDKGANVNQANIWGWSPLAIACARGHDAVVKLLLERGADIMYVETGHTAEKSALTLTQEKDHLKVAAVLREHLARNHAS